MKKENMTQADIDVIERALFIIGLVDPGWAAHIRRVIRTVIYDRLGCKRGAGGCTGTSRYGASVAVFVERPSAIGVIESMRIMRHESDHWRLDPWGQPVLIEHTCSDPLCSDPCERAADPIYARDDHFLPLFRHAYETAVEMANERARAMQPVLEGPTFGQYVGAAATGGLVGLLLGAGLRALFGSSRA